MYLKFCLWGCGKRGKSLFRFMQGRGVQAFIDTNTALHGKLYQGTPIISFETYQEKYRDCIVIITPHIGSEEIELLLRRQKILYLTTEGLPQEIIDDGRQDLFRIADGQIDKTGTIFLYGLNPFSIFLMDYYAEQQKYPVKILPEEYVDPKLIKVLEDAYPGCIGAVQEAGEQRVYITNAIDGRRDLPIKNRGNLYDFLYCIEEYRNPQIEALKDIHRGKRCFIVGCGPSLRMEDLDRLAERHEISISMNGIFKAFANTKWRPDYYVVGDFAGFEVWCNELERVHDIPYMLVGEDCLKKAVDMKHRPLSNQFISFHRSLTVLSDGHTAGFSKDFSRGAYPGGSIANTCIQLAVYLGCQEIYLYGIDHFGQQKCHFVDEDQYLSPLKATVWPDEEKKRDLQIMEGGYRASKKVLEELNITIRNASWQTQLDVFERVDFDSLF